MEVDSHPPHSTTQEPTQQSKYTCKYGCNATINTENYRKKHQSICKLRPKITTTTTTTVNACDTGVQTDMTMNDIELLLQNKYNMNQQCQTITTNQVKPQTPEEIKAPYVPAVSEISFQEIQKKSNKRLKRTLKQQDLKRTLRLQKLKLYRRDQPSFNIQKTLQVGDSLRRLADKNIYRRMQADRKHLSKESYRFKYEKQIAQIKEFRYRQIENLSTRTKRLLATQQFQPKQAQTQEEEYKMTDHAQFDQQTLYQELYDIDEVNTTEQITTEVIDCSDLVSELYTYSDCQQLRITLLSMKHHRFTLDHLKSTKQAFETAIASLQLSSKQASIVKLTQSLLERLIVNATSTTKTNRQEYLQALLSLRLSDKSYHKKIIVNFRPLLEKHFPLVARFTNKDLQITITELLDNSDGKVQNRLDSIKVKLESNIEHYVRLFNMGSRIMSLLLKVLCSMTDIQLDGFLEHMKQCEYIKHIPQQERALKCIVEEDAYQYTQDILECTYSHKLDCQHLSQQLYKFSCCECGFTHQVCQLFIPEVLQGIVKHKRAKKLSRQKLDTEAQKTMGLYQNLWNHQHVLLLEQGEQELYVEKRDSTDQELPLTNNNIQEERVCSKTNDEVNVDSTQAMVHQNIADLTGNFNEAINRLYSVCIPAQGQLDLMQFDETWQQRVKTCVVKYLTGLRTKKIDWEKYKK